MQAENELLLTDNPVQEDKETELMSVAILGVSLVMGLIGNAVFFHYRLGINIPIYTVIFVLAEAALLTTFQRKLAWKNTLFVIPVVLFAGLLSLYTAPPLVLLNIGLLAGTGFLLTRYATTPQFIGGHWISALLAAVEFGFIGWA
ncbi:MAG: hypothetical protein K8I82_29525, partial [Anaerolineae bacterium]|nr:hypothetical protein [Anaerolineae bacterium]